MLCASIREACLQIPELGRPGYVLQLHFRQVDARLSLVSRIITDVQKIVMPHKARVAAIASAGQLQNPDHLWFVDINRSQ